MALLWLQIWLPFSHDIEETFGHQFNPFPPLLDTMPCLNELVVIEPAIITRYVMHPRLHTLNYGEVWPQLLELFVRLFNRPLASIDIAAYM